MNEGMELFQLTDTIVRRATYQLIAERYQIKTALYPGSGVDIVPSLYIPHVVYLDILPLVNEFFQDRASVMGIIDKGKVYPGKCKIEYYEADYFSPPDLPQFDLLLSQNAGNVGQELKRFLKPGGILLVADGPADASLALHDPDYELIGTVRVKYDKCEILPGVQPRQFQYVDGADIGYPGLEPIKIPMPQDYCFRKR